jgi:hypothetical protein
VGGVVDGMLTPPTNMPHPCWKVATLGKGREGKGRELAWRIVEREREGL